MKKELEKYIEIIGDELKIKRAIDIEGLYVFKKNGQCIFKIHRLVDEIMTKRIITGAFAVVVNLKTKQNVIGLIS